MTNTLVKKKLQNITVCVQNWKNKQTAHAHEYEPQQQQLVLNISHVMPVSAPVLLQHPDEKQ